MIKTDKQFKIAQEQVQKFQDAIANLENNKTSMGTMMFDLQLKGLKSQLESLNKEIAEYSAIQQGDFSMMQNIDFENISKVLIKARLACGLSQGQLADKLNITQQQIHRYEATNYQAASLSRLIEIIDALGIKVKLDRVSLFDIAFDFSEATKTCAQKGFKKLANKQSFSLN